ncbi:MAG: glycosyltransferase [Chitinivibrionales bacterium]|nr:glycosyltransferase [Chitinivibrionales bacterium]
MRGRKYPGTKPMNRLAPPMVSVVIPLYNGEMFIVECLESVFAQTEQPVEIVVVDDGSTDKSVEIVKSFGGNITLVSQKNGDVSAARNAGVEAAGGELIAFLDQDDLWEQCKLEKQIASFCREPEIDLVFTDLIKIGASGKRHRPKDRDRIARSLTDRTLFKTLALKNLLMPSAVMVKKESFTRAGYFDESFATCGDYEMWLRMAGMDMRFRYVPEPLTVYRYHGANESKKTELMNADRIKAVEKTFANPLLPGDKKVLEKQSLSRAYREGAHTYFSAKNYRGVLNFATRAWKYDKRVINWKLLRRFVRAWVKTRTQKAP